MRSTLWLLSTLLLIACPSSDDSGEDTNADADTDTDTDSDSDTDTDTDTEGPSGSLSGDLTTTSGGPIANGIVHMCKGSCLPANADASGHYAFDALSPGDWTFVAFPQPGQPQAHASFPVTIELDVASTVDVILPELGTAVSLPGSAAEIEMAPGFFITVGQGDLEVSFEADPTAVSGVLVDAAHYPAALEISGTVVALWYLDPFEAEADPGLTIRLDNDWSLTVGDTYELWSMSYWDQAFLKVGDFTADATQLTATGAVLTEVNTFVLVDPTR